MKNAIYILVILACAGLIAFGVTRKNIPMSAELAAEEQAKVNAGQETKTGVAVKTASTTVPAAIGQVTQRFRPDTAVPVSASAETPEQAAERNFQVTPDLLAKMYLVDTYKPGICYGAPVAVPQASVESFININPPLADFLKQKYALTTDTAVYNKLKQIYGITLAETSSSKYDFSFMDGQCQTVTYYEGTVAVSGNSVTAIVSKQASHTYQ